ncbi:MAG: PadR family transcriptional regulator [Bacteroidota bacterium]
MSKNLGNLEETILLLVAVMIDKAYGYSVSEEYHNHFGQRISISAVHTVLKRLEDKGMIESKMGGATKERGGRKKRIFKVTNLGMNTLESLQQNRMKLWNMMPNYNVSD